MLHTADYVHIHLVIHSPVREGSDRVTDRGSTAGRNLEVHSIDDVEYGRDPCSSPLP